MAKHLNDTTKASLLAFLRSRAACGESSLKTWGQAQRPVITFGQGEEIANALVDDGLAERETRKSGEFVWRAVLEPASDEVEKEEAPPSVEEESVVVAGDAEGDAHTEALAQQVIEAERALAKQDRANDDLRLRFLSALDGSAQETWEHVLGRVRLLVAAAKIHAEAPAVEEDARIRDYLLALPEHLWQRIGAARAKIAKARQAVLDAQAAESKLLAEIGAVLDAPLDEPKKRKVVRVGEEPPRDSSLGQTLALVRAGHPGDHKSIADALGRTPEAARSDLRTLAERGLIERIAPGKYRAKEAA
jgi:hypothetical protein